MELIAFPDIGAKPKPRGQARRHRLGFFAIDVDDGDLCAEATETLSESGPEAGTTAGDQHRVSVKHLFRISHGVRL